MFIVRVSHTGVLLPCHILKNRFLHYFNPSPWIFHLISTWLHLTPDLFDSLKPVSPTCNYGINFSTCECVTFSKQWQYRYYIYFIYSYLLSSPVQCLVWSSPSLETFVEMLKNVFNRINIKNPNYKHIYSSILLWKY